MRDLHREITGRIVEQLRAGVVPWRKPWSGKTSGTFPRNAVTKRGYSGVNIIILWSAQEHNGYATPLWLTYRQAQESGGHVRKGEKGTQIVFMARFTGEKEDGTPKSGAFLKTYTVFNVAQCDDLPTRLTGVVEITPRHADGRCELLDEFVTATGAQIRHGGNRACFNPPFDRIEMPEWSTFENADKYYSTLAHELIHWTGDKRRLDRTFGKRFGDVAYTVEELVAELGSAFICSEFGIDNVEHNSAYIASWIKFLTEHDKALMSAASAASKATEYLRGKILAEDADQVALAA